GGPASTPPDGLPDVAQLVRALLARGGGDVYRRVQAEVDRVVLGEVLAAVGGNQVHASALLGISRNTRGRASSRPGPRAEARSGGSLLAHPAGGCSEDEQPDPRPPFSRRGYLPQIAESGLARRLPYRGGRVESRPRGGNP